MKSLFFIVTSLLCTAQEIPQNVQPSSNQIVLGVATNTTPLLNARRDKNHVYLNWVVSPLAQGKQEVRQRTDVGCITSLDKHKSVLALSNGYWVAQGDWKGPMPVTKTKYAVRIVSETVTNAWSNEIEVIP